MTDTSVTFQPEYPEEEKCGVMNPVGVVGIAMGASLVLALWLSMALPLAAALALAWIGGAVCSVMLMAVLAAIDRHRSRNP
jgi:hypothetical protein